MTQCDHPEAGQDRLVSGGRIGEYVVQVGSDLAQGPIPAERVDEARRLVHETTGATSRTIRSGDKRCSTCGAWWSEISVTPGLSNDGETDNLLSA
jgi:hypothetical protein